MKINKKGWDIHYKNNSNHLIALADAIIEDRVDDVCEITKVFKNDKRSYIAKIKFQDEFYILKSPKNETNIPQRKFMSIFKKGEALNTFERTWYYKDKGINILSDVFLVGVRRQHLMIDNSFMIIECIQGNETQPHIKEDVDKIK